MNARFRILALALACAAALAPLPAWSGDRAGIQKILDEAAKAIEAKQWEKAAAALAKAKAAAAEVPERDRDRAKSDVEDAQKDLDRAWLGALAADAWPAYEKKFPGTADIDPIDCIDHIDAWRGKTIRIDDFVDKAGRGFASADFDMIAVVNGTAVAMKFAPEVKRALAEFEARDVSIEYIHKEYVGAVTITDAAHVESVIGTVTGLGAVTVTDDIDGTSFTAGVYKAPLVKVQALKQGPIAVAAGEPTIVKKLPAR